MKGETRTCTVCVARRHSDHFPKQHTSSDATFLNSMVHQMSVWLFTQGLLTLSKSHRPSEAASSRQNNARGQRRSRLPCLYTLCTKLPETESRPFKKRPRSDSVHERRLGTIAGAGRERRSAYRMPFATEGHSSLKCKDQQTLWHT